MQAFGSIRQTRFIRVIRVVFFFGVAVSFG
jgi:hypothetical protein